MKLIRNCIICGKRLNINLAKDRKVPRHFYYFGKMKLPVGKGRWKKVGKSTVLSPAIDKITVAKWTGKEKEIEYWECNRCAKD